MAPSKVSVSKAKPSKIKLSRRRANIIPECLSAGKKKWFESFMKWYKAGYGPQMDPDNISNIIARDDMEATFLDFLMFMDKRSCRRCERFTYEEFMKRCTYEEVMNMELHKIGQAAIHFNIQETEFPCE